MKTTKKLIAVILTVLMAISMMPFTALADDVSFTKVTSVSQITAENIRTCTAEDAKTWALANWDVAHDNVHDTHLAFYSNTSELNVVLVDSGMNEKSFSKNFDYWINTDYSIDQLKTWYAIGHAICICTASASAPEEPAGGAEEDGPLVDTVIKIGDTLTLDGDYFEFAPGLSTSTTAELELYQISYNEDFNGWLFTFMPDDIVFLVEGDKTPKPDGLYVSGGNGTNSRPYTFALNYGPAPTEPNNGTNITVADTISENFYLDGDYYGADAYVTVNYNHNSNLSQTANFNTDDPQKLSEMDKISGGDYAGNSIISVIQAPAQSTEPITINVYASQADAEAGTNPVDTIEYSVYTYCREIIEGEYEDDVKDLAKATLDYAAAAQLYFNYNTDNMATTDNSGNAFYGDVAGVDFDGVAGVSSLATGIQSFSVVVKSDLEINLLSRTPINVENASIDTTGTSRFAAENTTNGDWYVVHISGIEPANMDNTFTVVTDKGNIEMSANAIMKLMANSDDENLVTLAKAMYLYGAAANAYFD